MAFPPHSYVNFLATDPPPYPLPPPRSTADSPPVHVSVLPTLPGTPKSVQVFKGEGRPLLAWLSPTSGVFHMEYPEQNLYIHSYVPKPLRVPGPPSPILLDIYN